MELENLIGLKSTKKVSYQAQYCCNFRLTFMLEQVDPV